MKKRFLLTFLIMLSAVNIAFGKTISDIDSFKFSAREITTVNGKRRTKDYSVKAILPDMIKKEILFPEENKGEIYIYNKGKKIVYLPLFDQAYEEELNDEENYMVKIIKDIKEREKKDSKFKSDFYNGKVKEIEYDNGLRIVFEKLDQIDGYYFPVQISVYDEGSKISEIILKEVIINPKLEVGEFER